MGFEDYEPMFEYMDNVVIAINADVEDDSIIVQWAKQMYLKGKTETEAIRIIDKAYSMYNRWRNNDKRVISLQMWE